MRYVFMTKAEVQSTNMQGFLKAEVKQTSVPSASSHWIYPDVRVDWILRF